MDPKTQQILSSLVILILESLDYKDGIISREDIQKHADTVIEELNK